MVGALAARAQTAAAQDKSRILVLVDSSGSMLQAPEILDPIVRDTCGFDPCTARSGPVTNPDCNGCVAYVAGTDSYCRTTRWDSACASAYQSACGCGAYEITDAIGTRGDGSAENPGCDVDGDGLPNDSRLFQAKAALQIVLAAFGEVEFALARFAQIRGGNTCTSPADCPSTPAGGWVCNGGYCKFDAAVIGSAGGQCSTFTWSGCNPGFDCDSCVATSSSFERRNCVAYAGEDICDGGVSPINGTPVDCFTPNNRYITFAGAYGTSCNPLGGEVLVGFPPTTFDDNYGQILSWIDHVQPTFNGNEIRATGATPIAGSLRDIRRYLVTAPGGPLFTDLATPCRSYSVILLTDGGESCENVSDAVAAAAALQNLSVTRSDGTRVTIDVSVHVIGFAICPPSDPNCQTIRDLDAIAAAGCDDPASGVCRKTAFRVTNQLELQATLAEIVAASIKSERCNGRDDDCDKLIDEDFPELGSACAAGLGACRRDGAFVCTADQRGVKCTARPGAPMPEICNDIDDDCNGLIDDGIDCAPCAPQTEVCNGRDDDCDGAVDENTRTDPLPGVGAACGVDIGACEPGATICSRAGAIVCDGGAGPREETCNGIDDDCDTITDGLIRDCYPTATPGCDPVTGTCLGICRFGTESCPAGGTGRFGPCEGAVTPGAEIACNLLDDDCDGAVDEGAGAELCNAIDDDCDGAVDEDVASTDPAIGVACGTPPFAGACRPGRTLCVGGVVECDGEIDPRDELCDDIDNDCDGATDEDLPPPFGEACGTDVGTCAPGTLRCVDGAASCDDIGPAAEVCNGLDDNCNSRTDETDPRLGEVCAELPGGARVDSDAGECQFGVLICTTAGVLECFGARGPTAERCNGLDDDCDGATDEEFPALGLPCDNGQQGVCFADGVFVCNATGDAAVCNAPMGFPVAETCNGLDDDCDGPVDEEPLPLIGTECSPSIGLCEPGLWECNAGELECGSPATGSSEICNAADDDCDGLVDESPVPGEGEDCVDPGFEAEADVGECEFGDTACIAGELACVGYQGPRPEVCNGLDDDCDGVGDDLAACPEASNACHEGECVIPCELGEFPCPSGFVCRSLPDQPPPGMYCVPDPCADVRCGASERCDHDTGRCVDLCAGVSCRGGEQCRNGLCLDCFDLPTRCLEGELCIADDDGVGQCEDDPCEPNPCASDQACVDGGCQDCNCATGEVCVSGVCEPDLCAGVDCTFGRICNPRDGECGNPNCEGVRCNAGEVCVPISGECIADPCEANTCPLGEVCAIRADGSFACQPPPVATGERVTAAGGGCRASQRSPGGAGAWLLGVALLALVRRRRR
jgi:hypothetical protein